jgi:hypothetical protein
MECNKTMGIRPSMRLIMGVENPSQYTHKTFFADNWHDKKVELSSTPRTIIKDEDIDLWLETASNYLLDKSKKESLKMIDVFYFGDNVAGYIIEEIPYGNACLYALAALDERFQEYRY